MRLSKDEILTIPNLLSFLRLILIPIFIYFYLNADNHSDYYIATFIILISSLTDLLDGRIARKYGQITEFGKALDPVADKLTQIAIAFCLLFRYQYMWILLSLLVVKELFMGINGLVLLRRGKKLDGAMWFGKAATAVFYIVSIILIAFPTIKISIANFLISIAGFFLILSFLLYIPEYLKLYRR